METAPSMRDESFEELSIEKQLYFDMNCHGDFKTLQAIHSNEGHMEPSHGSSRFDIGSH
jgi:hypothetical protein